MKLNNFADAALYVPGFFRPERLDWFRLQVRSFALTNRILHFWYLIS